MATGRIGVTPTLGTRWSKAPAGGTTSLSGLDDNSVSLVYSVGYEQVYRNGVLLSRGNDYTATTGNSITLIDATIAGDIIEVFANELVPLTDAISKGQFTAKGALLSATAASTPGVLAVGTNGQYLTANSSTSTGLEWSTLSAGGMTLLSTTTLSGTSTTISGISGSYTDLLVLVNNALLNSGAWLRINPNSTGSISRNVYMKDTAVSNSGDIYSQDSLPSSSNAAANVYALLINNYAGTSYGKPFLFYGNNESSNTTVISAAGVISTTSAITSLQITADGTASFTAGQVLIYGVK